MSTFKVTVTQVEEMLVHENAERLAIAKIYGWNVVTQKDRYQAGSKVVYIPVDAILPKALEEKLFPEGSKIKLHNSRVRSIKIRGAMSQGMIVDAAELGLEDARLEADVAEHLGITKYEPPVSSLPKGMYVKTSKKVQNPNFSKYSDIENLKYYDRVLQDGEVVVITEKLHGTSARYGYHWNIPNTIWKKVLSFLGLLSKWEFCWGSRNVQIQNKLMHTGYYDEDVYTKMIKQYDLLNRIPKGLAIYGEIVGDGIQKNYTYGCGPGEHKLYVYDIKDVSDPEVKNHRWLNHDEFLAKVKELGLETVPQLYTGPWSMTKALEHRDGDSTIGRQKVREGVVVKPVIERSSTSMGRVILKFISDNYYLDTTNTDHH